MVPASQRAEWFAECDVKASFDAYIGHIRAQSAFFRESGQYSMRGKGDTDMWKLFLERMMGLMTKDGMMAIVIPSGILTNQGARELRKAMLGMKIASIYEFENRRKIFPEVDSRYKFVLLTASNAEPAPSFKSAFYLHDIASLDGKAEREKFLTMPLELVSLTSPEELTIPEVRAKRDVEILNHVYQRHGCVRDGLDNGKYTIGFVSEFHKTNSNSLFRRDGKGWPLVEGENFHQFIPNYTKPEFTILQKVGLEKTSRISKYSGKNKEIHETVRLAFRDVASSTNIRTMISCIIPPRMFFSNKAPTVVIQHNKSTILDKAYYRKILYLAAVFNSMTFDYLLRVRVNLSLNFFIVDGVAIPHDSESVIANRIIELSAKLTLQNQDFVELAKKLQLKIGKLTTPERIETVAKIDALVAHHYGLTKNQYEYILSTFKPKQKIDLEQDVEWDDGTIHAFYHEVKKQALKFYEAR